MLDNRDLRGELRSIDWIYATRLPIEMRLLRRAEEGGPPAIRESDR
jgi:hypothetical protein